jgi:hypothetical protein
MDLRVPVQRFVPTLPHLCAKWDTHPVRLTLTWLKADTRPDNNQYVLLDLLLDHRRLDTALKLSDQTVVQDDNRTYEERTTIDWQLYCQWKDRSTSWENLSDLKESLPIETAEYAVAMDIDHKPAFN